MQLGELETVKQILACHPLGNDKLWQNEPHSINEFDICLFYARSGIDKKYSAAKLIQAVQDALIGSDYITSTNNLPHAFLLHEAPKEPFYVDEFVEGLSKLSTQSCLATIFSLESRIEPSVVAKLTWKDSRALNNLNQIAEEILDKAARRRHPRIPYLFWEKLTPTLTAPIFDLSKKIENAFGMDWAKLLYSYEEMIPVCRESEAKHFNSIIRT